MPDAPLPSINRLLTIMADLRNPDGGCPWDVEQTHASIAPCAIEEAYEVVDAITRGDMQDLKEELGDLLLQVVFHSRMAEEAGTFTFADVADAICEKLVTRHPHVFGDATVEDATAQEQAWEAIKQQERAAKVGDTASQLDGVTAGLPGLLRAVKLTKKAAKVGFDWQQTQDIFAKLEEETNELKEALAENQGTERCEEELGDLLFVCANLARHMKIDPEVALTRANQKFEQRFRQMEALSASRNAHLKGQSLDELDALWEEAKATLNRKAA